MENSYGKDKLLRADTVLEAAQINSPVGVTLEGRAVQVLFGPSYRSPANTNDEILLFHTSEDAYAYFVEIRMHVN